MFNNVKLGIAPIGWTNDDMPQLGQYPQSYQQLRTGFTQPKSQEFFERGESANDGFFGREL